MFDYSQAGLSLTKSFEGLRLQAYRDMAGILTIGYGHTGAGIYDGQVITEDEADHLLHSDVAASVAFVNRAVTTSITQNQFDALVDFCFNAGRGNLLGSTLLKCVNSGDHAGAVDQFGRWVHAGGAVAPGLVRRRAAEAALYATP